MPSPTTRRMSVAGTKAHSAASPHGWIALVGSTRPEGSARKNLMYVSKSLLFAHSTMSRQRTTESFRISGSLTDRASWEPTGKTERMSSRHILAHLQYPSYLGPSYLGFATSSETCFSVVSSVSGFGSFSLFSASSSLLLSFSSSADASISTSPSPSFSSFFSPFSSFSSLLDISAFSSVFPLSAFSSSSAFISFSLSFAISCCCAVAFSKISKSSF
mmetsp:Transcript_128763/g.248070  ORF Transcript_128763/g.248070 Transcript_128763/m.248070 type:complete len:217 (-) Transcript_128763:113-763(-)